ncbi:MAG: rhomboid family intramembrane serine protease [Pirellulales bacterium]
MNPYRQLTIFGLIAIAVMVFAVERRREATFADDYGAVPAIIVPAFRSLVDGDVSLAVVRELLRTVTALFLHGDAQHLLFNMVFLWTFGCLTSETLGQWQAVIVFLVCGICGNLVQIWLEPESLVPIIGASGAICGFEGVYLGLALSWQLAWPNVWPLAYPVPPLQLGAFAVIGFIGDVYFLTQQRQGIAYGAHIGGLLSGLAIAALVTTIYRTADAYQRPRLP